MTSAIWLGTYLLHSTILYALVMPFRGRLREVRGAEIVWRAVVLVPLVSATLGARPFVHVWTVQVPMPAAGSAATAMGGIGSIGSSLPADAVSWFAFVWLIVAVVLFVRDGLAYWYFLHHLGHRQPIDRTTAALLSDVIDRAHAGRFVRITHSAQAPSPIALWRSEICLPTRALTDLGPAEVRALVAHEAAHIARRDGAWLLGLACVQNVLFMQPLTRVARKELQHLAELACDDRAAQQLADPVAMARCLVEVAAWSRARQPTFVPGVIGASGLSARVTRLLERPPRECRRVPPPLALAVAALLAPCLPALTVSPRDLTRSFALPAAFGSRSPEFMAGFQAGQRYARGEADASLRTLIERRAGNSPPRGMNWRADLERQLQKQSARGRR